MIKNTDPKQALVKTVVSGSVILPADLRIGNLVYDDENIIVKVEKIVSELYQEWNDYDDEECTQFSKIGEKGMFYSKVSPIPITKEWLLKLGFEQKGSFYRIENSRFVEILIHDDGIDVCNHSVYLPHIKYVHQLQNLYYNLIGSRLRVVL